jgi:type I restriction enzyme S subunit
VRSFGTPCGGFRYPLEEEAFFRAHHETSTHRIFEWGVWMSNDMSYASFGSLLKKVVDNRGRTCPTSDTGLPLIATNCVTNKYLYPQFINVRYVNDETYRTWFRGHPLPGDMLFVLKGTPGRVAWVPDPVGFCIAQDMVAIRADENQIYPKYLFAVLRSSVIQQEIEGLHVGSLIPHFKKSDFDDLKIPIVTKSLQKYIGNLYFNLSLKIDLLHRQNKTLEAIAEALFRQWLSPATAGGEGADVRTVQLGEMIEIYDSRRIPLSSTERDKMKTGPLYPYYGAATIMDYINDYIFDGECLLFGEDGTVQTDEGFPILQLAVGRYWVNNHTHVLVAKKPYSNFLLYSILRRTSISHIVTGAVQPKINQENLRSLEVEVLSEEKISDIVTTTNHFWNKIKHNNVQIRTLEKLRDTLLPKLMSGEVRVET